MDAEADLEPEIIDREGRSWQHHDKQARQGHDRQQSRPPY
jgi:hypothetical protein